VAATAVRVFIVEDDRMVIETYREILKLYGLEVVGWSYSGEDAVKRYPDLTPRPDVVIMDHRLPIMDGIEATKEILKLDRNAKVLFVSADYTAKGPALERGACGFIRKPFDLKEFVAVLRRMAEE
jgi:DNA-binding NarL/FixJ family response regulator